MASASVSRSRWLFGPAPDLLLGCGGAYVAVFLLMCVAGDSMSTLAPLGLLPLLTLYLTWSPWHYTGQNYGIASMMLGRRGVQLAQPVRRARRYSVGLSYELTCLAMHGGERVAKYTLVP